MADSASLTEQSTAPTAHIPHPSADCTHSAASATHASPLDGPTCPSQSSHHASYAFARGSGGPTGAAR